MNEALGTLQVILHPFREASGHCIPGAMLGGLLIGLAEAFTTAYISSTFQNLIVFGILIVVLLVRPRGLLGKPELVKV